MMAACEQKSSAIVNTIVVENHDEVTLDNILVYIGQLGKFQTLIFLLICVPMMFNAIFSVTYVFTAGSLTYRCNITECDTADSRYEEEWINYAIPIRGSTIDQCHRFNANTSITVVPSGVHMEDGSCLPWDFDRNRVVSCPTHNLILRDQEVTISNEFDIFCSDEWKLSLVGTLNNVGQFVGIPIGGFVSDRYGRRTALAIGGFAAAILGIVRSFATSYTYFLIFEFLDSLAASPLYSICFIVGIELVGPKKRVMACSLVTIFYAVGEVLLALFAKYYKNWRVLLRILYIPALVLVLYFWILPESVRWLLGQQREEEAKEVLRKAASVNSKKLPEDTLEQLVTKNRVKLESCTEGKFPLKLAFLTLFWRITNCALCWIVNVLIYYGLSLNAVLLDGDKYNNFIFMAMVEIPGFLLPLLIMDRFGRRWCLSVCMFLSGFCCLATVFLPSDVHALQLSMFLLGKLTITTSFQVLYFFTSEIFPTNLRNSLLSFCSMVGRLGSMLAPFTPLLAKYNDNAPAILFSASAIISAAFSLLFPETTNLVLPSTMKEADTIGTAKKNNQLT